MPYRSLNRPLLLRALTRLSEFAVAENLVLEISLYGGAVFTLVYESREATKDVDAIVRPSEAGRRLARRVATELDLPEDWINDDVRQFIAAQESKRRYELPNVGPGLVLSIPTASYLLALKLHAFRSPLPGYPGDHDDIVFLLRKMDVRTADEAAGHHQAFFPHDVLTPDRRAILESLVTRAHAG